MLIRDAGMVGGLKPASKSNSNHHTNRIVLDQRDSRQKLMNLLALLTFLICFASQLLQPTTAFFMQGPNTPLNAERLCGKVYRMADGGKFHRREVSTWQPFHSLELLQGFLVRLEY